MRVMLVDDHAGFRQMVITLLRPAGLEFIECEDGQAAVQAYPNARPDLVIMDIAMKGLDGLKATRQIRASFPTAHIVMLTQYDDPDLRVAARQAGAAAYLLKDDLSELQLLLSSLAAAARATRS